MLNRRNLPFDLINRRAIALNTLFELRGGAQEIPVRYGYSEGEQKKLSEERRAKQDGAVLTYAETSSDANYRPVDFGNSSRPRIRY